MIDNLSIIIPVYNEEERVVHGVQAVLDFCKQNIKHWEIIIVDDGSIDRTRYYLGTVFQAYEWPQHSLPGNRIYLISYTPNKGKGYAIKTGVEAAQYENILYTDIDQSTPIKEIQNLFRYRRDYDIIIGSRNLPTSKVEPQGIVRRILGKTFAVLVEINLGLGIKDTQCGFKLFTKKAAKECFAKQQISGWAFDAELLYIAKKARYKIKEVGVQWKNDVKTKLKATAPIRMLSEISSIKRLHGKNKKNIWHTI